MTMEILNPMIIERATDHYDCVEPGVHVVTGNHIDLYDLKNKITPQSTGRDIWDLFAIPLFIAFLIFMVVGS